MGQRFEHDKDPVRPLRIVILGLSITSSWGNGHATTYRGLVRQLVRHGHDVLFLERDVPWYADNRDLAKTRYGRIELYRGLDELKARFTAEVRTADCVVVGSYVPEGDSVGDWVTSTAQGVRAFYDIDTPVTLAAIEQGTCDYLNRTLLPRYDLYLSFTGGPILKTLENVYKVPAARVLYCSIDPNAYSPDRQLERWQLGYLGTYSADRQTALEHLLIEPARAWRKGRFVVAGPQYPDDTMWPSNVQKIEHLPPAAHRSFYNAQQFTLNVTRADMVKAGYSPSIRLFEAAACATPIITDYWVGLETIFEPGREILISRSTEDVLRYLRDLPENHRSEIGWRARQQVIREHTTAHRARTLEEYILKAREKALLNAG
jgi:spore maturation protein CgeB